MFRYGGLPGGAPLLVVHESVDAEINCHHPQSGDDQSVIPPHACFWTTNHGINDEHRADQNRQAFEDDIVHSATS
jgi:hypothetical protein